MGDKAPNPDFYAGSTHVNKQPQVKRYLAATNKLRNMPQVKGF
jgi:hypothetical protein